MREVGLRVQLRGNRLRELGLRVLLTEVPRMTRASVYTSERPWRVASVSVYTSRRGVA